MPLRPARADAVRVEGDASTNPSSMGGKRQRGSVYSSVVAASSSGARLEMIPSCGEFINYDVDTTYVMSFTIRNRTPEMQTLRVIPPQKPNTAFRVVNTESVRVAAGLSHTIDVEFTTHTQSDYADFFTLLNANGERFEVRLIAKSVPELKFASVIDFGRVEHASVGLSKPLTLINRGRRDAMVTLTSRFDTVLAVAPSTTIAKALAETTVAVELLRLPLGTHQWPVLVSVEGEPEPKEVTVRATIVDCRSKLLDPRTGAEVLSVAFGAAYAGTKKSYELTVVNGSERDTSFAFQLANELVAKDAPPFRFVPEQGRLGPKEARKVLLIFEPPLNAQRKGWSCQQQHQHPVSRKFEGLFSLMFVETEQTHGFHVTGESTDTSAWLSHSVLDFGDCGLNDYRNTQLEIHNGADELPLQYAFAHVANFRFSKPTGTVSPGSVSVVEVTFQPRRLGRFNDRVEVTFNDTVKRALVLAGLSTPSTAKATKVGGPNALPEDFKRKAQNPHRPRPHSGDGLNGAQRRDADALSSHVAAVDLPAAVDLGMVPAAGLRPPQPATRVLPRDLQAEDCALNNSTSAHVAPVSFDVKALIKRRYPEAPSNAMERRDCRRELMPMDLLKVVAPVKVVQFGRVTVNSQATKSFYVHNGSGACILATMPAEEPSVTFTPQSQIIPPNRMAQFDVCLCSSVIQSSQQVIQFTLNSRHHMRFTLQADVVPVEVTLSQHEAVLNFAEFTEEPITKAAITMSNDGNSDAPFQWVLPAKVPFMIAPISGVLPPMSKQTAEVTFTPPQGVLDVQCDASLVVEGASGDKQLRLSGVVAPTRCAWGKGVANSSGDALVDLRRIPAGRGNTTAVTLVNRGSNNAFFSFDNLPEWLRVSPPRGRVCGGESEELTLSVRLQREASLQHTVLCNVRGMRKPLRLLLSATVVAPSIAVTAPEKVKGELALDFGGVYVGADSARILTFRNGSDVSAVVHVDLRSNPGFYVRKALVPAVKEESGEAVLAAVEDIAGLDDDDDEVRSMSGSDHTELLGLLETHDQVPHLHRHHDPGVSGVVGRFFAITIRAGAETSVEFGYAPRLAGRSEQFAVLWYQVGADEMHPLPPLVLSAQSLAPVLALSVASLSFPQVVTNQQPKPQVVFVRNLSAESVRWSLEPVVPGGDSAAADGHFLVEPRSGQLAPDGRQQVTVTFLADAVGSFVGTYELLSGTDTTRPCGRLVTEASAVKPRLLCDRRAIVFPPVPLGVEVRESLFLINDGFDCISVQYDGECTPPLSINFPSGSILSTAAKRVLVELSFCSARPVTLNSSIVFSTNMGEYVSLSVAATAVNSVLTTNGFLRYHESHYKIQSAAIPSMPPQPFTLTAVKGDALGPVTIEVGGRGQSLGCPPMAVFGMVDTVGKLWNSRGAQDGLTRWCNANLLRNPVANILDALQGTRGNIAYDVVERLFGRRPRSMPGTAVEARTTATATSARAGGSAAMGPRRSRAGTANSEVPRLTAAVAAATRRAAAASKGVAVLETLLSFLCAYGCCLASVQMRYLLSYEEYTEYVLNAATNANSFGLRSGAAAEVTGGGGRKKGDDAAAEGSVLTAQQFQTRATHAWTTVLLETIRVFYLSRLRLASVLKQMPNIGKHVPMHQWASRSFAECLEISNVYSAEESLLMQWLRFTAVRYGELEGVGGTGGGPGSSGAGVTTAAFAPYKMRLQSFEDARDARFFIAAVLVYVPALRAEFFSGDRQVITNPSTVPEHEQNAQLLLSALAELGAAYLPNIKQFLEMNQVDLILFTAFLFSYLPRFVPSSTITFNGKLLSTITQVVEVVNGSSSTRNYRVHLDNSEFHLSKREFSVAPGAIFSLELSVTPKFQRIIRSQCIVIDHSPILPEEREPLTSDLLVTPTAEPTKVITLETPLYEPVYMDLMVESPFQHDCVVALRATQEYSPAAVRMPGSAAETGAPAAAAELPEVQFGNHYRNAFFVSADVLPLRPGEAAKVPVQFLPLSRGRYTLTITFREEKEGEFSYEVVGTCVAPKPAEVISEFRAELEEDCRPSINVRSSNVVFERAIRIFEERCRQMQSGTRTPRQIPSMAGNTYAVQFLNEELQGPNPFYEVDKGSGGFFTLPEDSGVAPLHFIFKPKYVGVYRGFVMLSSQTDVRLFRLSGECVPKGEHRTLRFSCPARQSISQDITINNFSAKDWLLTATLEGDGFSGLRELRAPQGKRKEYTLRYSPAWITEEAKGRLVLMNTTTGQKHTYTLIAMAEPPLSEDVLHLSCRARVRESVVLTVPNVTANDCTYFVESDLPFTEGDSSLVVSRASFGKYTLDITPTVGGTYSGKIVFKSHQGRYVWFVINLTVAPPDKEGTVVLATDVRTTVVADVKFTNPLNKALTFVVKRIGAGLYGDNSLQVEPGETITYSCTFVPSHVGTTEGRLSFCNDEIGEFWYELKMTVEDSTPEELRFESILGIPTSARVRLPNMTERECALMVQNTNPTNFSINPAIVVLPPNSEMLVDIAYTPTAVGAVQQGTVTLSHPQLGHWRYTCEGVGIAPTPRPPMACVCEMGSSATVSLPFTNALDVDTGLLVTLGDNKEGFFSVKRIPQGAIPAGTEATLLIGYVPKSVGQHSTVVEVRPQVGATAAKYDVVWVYRIEGRSEWRDTSTTLRFRCASRRQQEDVVVLRAPGLTPQEKQGATIAFSPDAGQHYLSAIKASFTCELPGTDSFPDAFEAHIRFSPLRPLAASGDLLVCGAGGGTWRYRVHLEGSPAAVDDTIKLSSVYNAVTNVTFDLYNAFSYKSKFAAYFTSDSSRDFAVSPTQGVLLPFVSGQRTAAAATPIKITFKPTSRVPQVEGTLIVDTEDMQWSFRVVGRLDTQTRPTAK